MLPPRVGRKSAHMNDHTSTSQARAIDFSVLVEILLYLSNTGSCMLLTHMFIDSVVNVISVICYHSSFIPFETFLLSGPRVDRQVAANAGRCRLALHRTPAVQQGQGSSGRGAQSRCSGDTRHCEARQQVTGWLRVGLAGICAAWGEERIALMVPIRNRGLCMRTGARDFELLPLLKS